MAMPTTRLAARPTARRSDRRGTLPASSGRPSALTAAPSMWTAPRPDSPKPAPMGTSNGLWTGSASFWVNTTSTADQLCLAPPTTVRNTAVVLNVNENACGLQHRQSVDVLPFEGGYSQSGLPDTPNNTWRDGTWHQVTVYLVASAGTGSDGHNIYIDGVAQGVSAYHSNA